MNLKNIMLVVLLSILMVSCSRSSSIQSINTYFQEREVNIPEMLQQTGLLPKFPPLIVTGPMHITSEVTTTTIAGSKASQTSGLTEWKPDSDERIGLFCNNSTKTSWAYYKTGGYTEAKPVEIDFHIFEWKPDSDERIPMRYYFGIANYTTHAWEWHGPYLQDPYSFKGDINQFILNSESLRDRYLSLNGVFSYVVVASNIGMSTPPADGKVGVNFGKASTENNSTAQTTKPLNTQIDDVEVDSTVPSKYREASSSTSIKLSWKHYFTNNPKDDATEYYIYRQHEDEDKPGQIGIANPPTGKPGDVVDMQFIDKDNLNENKAYKYFIQAHNSAGSTPLSFAREVVIPAVPRWHSTVVRPTGKIGVDNSLSRIIKFYNGSSTYMPAIACQNSNTGDLLYLEADRRRPFDENSWKEYVVAKGDKLKTGYGVSMKHPSSAGGSPHISYFSEDGMLNYSRGEYNSVSGEYTWTNIPILKSDIPMEYTSSIAFYSFEQPILAFYRRSSTLSKVSLAIAKKADPVDISDFAIVDVTGSIGGKDAKVSMILKYNSLPILAYYDSLLQKINLVYWTKFDPYNPTDIDSNQFGTISFEPELNGLGKSPSLAQGTDNYLHLSYLYGATGGLKYARSIVKDFTKVEDFSIVNLDATRSLSGTSIGLLTDNTPFISNISEGIVVPRVLRSNKVNPQLVADWNTNEEVLVGSMAGSNISAVAIDKDPSVCYIDSTQNKFMYSVYYSKPSKPSTPALPFASTDQVDGVHVSWDPSQWADGYYIYRGYRDKPIATVDAMEGTNYIDTEVPNFEPWVYYIQAYNEAGVSGMSSYIGRKFDGVAAPTDVFATDGDYNDKIKIGWNAPSIGPKPDGYIVQRSEDGGKNWNTINTTTLTESEDKVDLDKKTERVKRYLYQVLATLKGKNDSSPSLPDSGFANHVWQTYSVVDSVGDVHINQIISSIPVVKFNGKPVFLYLYTKSESSSINIAYGKIDKPILQTDWETYEVLNTSSFGSDLTGLSLAVVNGKLAIAFGCIDLFYGYANNEKPIIPNDWSFHKAVLNTAGSGLGENCSLAEIQSKPAIAFQGYDKADSTKTYLLYAYGLKAEPKDTTGWVYEELKSAILDPGSKVAPSMIQFNNQPAVAYQATSTYTTSSDYIKYFYRPTDLSSYYYNLTEGTNNCTNPCQKLLNGYPAISYRSIKGLEFIYTISGKPDTNSWVKCYVGNDWDYSGFYSSLDTELNVPAISSMGKDETSTNSYLKYSISSSGLPNSNNWMHMTVEVNSSVLSHTGLFMGLSKPVILWYDWTDPLNGKIKCSYAE